MTYDKKASGFTLIELLVVFSVLAIIGAFGFAALVNYSRTQTLSNAARDFRSHLKLAQSKAIVQEKPSGVGQCSSPSPLNAYRLNISNNGNGTDVPMQYQIWALCSTTVEVGRYSLPIPVIKTSGPNFFDFSVMTGSVTPSFFNIALDAYGLTENITVSSTGVIQ